jgi:microcystin-dependent protein
MSILVKGTDFGPTEQVTSGKLDNLVDAASFTNTSEVAVNYSGSTGTCLQGGGLEVTSAGQLQIQDGEVDLVKLSTNNQLNSGLYGVLDKVYPVGSIYISTVSTNPDELMFGNNGDTTWVAYATGRTLIGVGSGTDSQPTPETVAFTAGTEAGEYNHTLTSSESGVPAHAHKFRITGDSTPDSGTTGGIMVSGTGSTVNGVTGTPTDTAGQQIGGNTAADASSSHNNLPPYIVTYMWKRTA